MIRLQKSEEKSQSSSFWKKLETDLDMMGKKAKYNLHTYRKKEVNVMNNKTFNP